jgi:hypothetical protein
MLQVDRSCKQYLTPHADYEVSGTDLKGQMEPWVSQHCEEIKANLSELKAMSSSVVYGCVKSSSSRPSIKGERVRPCSFTVARDEPFEQAHNLASEHGSPLLTVDGHRPAWELGGP